MHIKVRFSQCAILQSPAVGCWHGKILHRCGTDCARRCARSLEHGVLKSVEGQWPGCSICAAWNTSPPRRVVQGRVWGCSHHRQPARFVSSLSASIVCHPFKVNSLATREHSQAIISNSNMQEGIPQLARSLTLPNKFQGPAPASNQHPQCPSAGALASFLKKPYAVIAACPGTIRS